MDELARDVLRFNLLGGMEISVGDEPVTGLASRKVRALLCYLVVTGRMHRRDALAGLLWGDVPEPKAKASLRSALHSLRRQIDDYLIVARDTVDLDRAKPHWLDVAEFTAVAEAALGISRGLPAAETGGEGYITPEQVEALWKASELYRGEFLEGFSLPDAPPFQDWMLMKRDLLRTLVLQVLQRLLAYHTYEGSYQIGTEVASRILSIEPWLEEGHRAMMRLLALSGQRGAALAQYETCRAALDEKLGLEPSLETKSLYRQIATGELVDRSGYGGLSVSAPRRHNLPAQATTFVGREEELRRLNELLLTSDCRLVTLVGVGGGGKTRLALAVAEQLQTYFTDGVWFVPLAELTFPANTTSQHPSLSLQEQYETVVLAIAKALGVNISGQGPALEHLLKYLQGRELLLLLDNAEHLLFTLNGSDDRAGLVALVTDLIRGVPGLRILVTSRQRLELQSECVVEVEGLPVPGERDPDAEDYGCIELFLERAARARSAVGRDGLELSLAAQVCRAVDGLPLGIELAAAWAGRLDLADIARAIEQSRDFLSTTMRDIPERQRSIRAVFEHSWHLLSDQEQANLARLAVFKTSFSEHAALAVARASRDDLGALVDRSLLRRVEPRRYAWHALLQRFAVEKLQDLADGGLIMPEETFARHSEYYLEFVAQRGAMLVGRQPQMAASEIQREWENVKQAWDWATVNAVFEPLERSIDALSCFLALRGLTQQGKHMFSTAVEAMGREPCSELGIVQSRLLAEIAGMLTRQGHSRQAIAVADRVVEVMCEHERVDLESVGHLRLGAALLLRGEHRTAKEHLEKAIALLGESSSRRHRADVLRYSGLAAMQLGDYDTAQGYLEQAREISRVQGDAHVEANVLMEYGRLQGLQGDCVAARDSLERALMIFHRVGDVGAAGVVYHRLGQAAQSMGDQAAAQEYYEQALRTSRDAGERWGEAETLTSLSLLLHHQGNDRVAAAIGRQAVELAKALGARAIEARALSNLAHALTGLGLWTEARETYERALTMWQEIGHPWPVLEVQAGMARVAMAQSDLAEASARVEAILENLGVPSCGADDPLRVHLTCYRVLQEVGDPRALEVLESAYSALQKLAAGIGSEETRRLFFEQVPAHRELMLAWEMHRGQTEVE